MGLQGLALSTTTRASSGDGLEDTIADFMYCWALACCADVKIMLLGETDGKIEAVRLSTDFEDDRSTLRDDNHDMFARKALLDVMLEIRDVLRCKEASTQGQKYTTTKVALRIRLTVQAVSVANAVGHAFREAWNVLREEGVPFVMVVHNAPLAPFADVFVVAGKTRKPSYKDDVGHEGKGPPTESDLEHCDLFVAIQTKHYTASVLTPLEALEEHRKSGCAAAIEVFQATTADVKAGDASSTAADGAAVAVANPSAATTPVSAATTPVSAATTPVSAATTPTRYAEMKVRLQTIKTLKRENAKFMSLVLVVHNKQHKYPRSSAQISYPVEHCFEMRTVWIRSGALRSVLHPIDIGSDSTAKNWCCSDAELADLRPPPSGLPTSDGNEEF